MKIKNIINLLLPPIITRIIKKYIVSNRQSTFIESTGEKNENWYDKSYKKNKHFHNEYYKSPYYFIWTVIIDRVIYNGGKLPYILELGSGTGQLAHYLQNSGVKDYTGVDFSKIGIEYSKERCTGFNFINNDFFKVQFNNIQYDTVICCETLEHLENDIDLIKKIKPGARFIGTVPDFPWLSHVRYFNSEEEVLNRYSDLFQKINVNCFLNSNKNRFYLIDGIIRNN